jgi:plastocyanin
MTARRLASIAAALALGVATAGAATVLHVVQHGRSFDRDALDVAAGDVVQFSNEDPFLHQIYVAAPGFSFDSDEQPPGAAIAVTFTKPGVFEVRCHIHPKMLLKVTVK